MPFRVLIFDLQYSLYIYTNVGCFFLGRLVPFMISFFAKGGYFGLPPCLSISPSECTIVVKHNRISLKTHACPTPVL